MRKFLLTVVVACMALFSTASASAQDEGFSLSGARAVGLRFGPDLSISYQQNFREAMFLEANLSFPYSFGGFGVDVTNNWLFNIGSSNFNWYAGVGAGVGFNWTTSYFELDLIPRIGIEYNFSGAPLQIAADYKPAIGFIFGGDSAVGFAGYNFGLALRYRF
ncbi:MAG: hypothetical protein R3Y49_00655 [Rikenellaceae bacterium]